MEAQIRALHDLIEIAKGVVSTLDIGSVLTTILESAMRFAGMPAGNIALYDELTREFTLHAHSGFSASFVKLDRWAFFPGGLTEHVFESRSIVFVEDLKQSSFPVHPLAVKEGIRSVVAIPLLLQNRILGIICLDDFSPKCFDEERLELLSVLASFASLAVENANLHNQTRMMAITDSLTGLYNRRYFQQIFDQEIERARRYRKPLSVIMMDVDDFKKFNDRHGHCNGDRVLAAVGEIITETLRSVDCAFRYGGEEFLVLLPETRMASAVQVAERLRGNVASQATARVPEVDDNITVSLGVASFPTHATSADRLLDLVDALLYRAKSEGKNTVHYKS